MDQPPPTRLELARMRNYRRRRERHWAVLRALAGGEPAPERLAAARALLADVEDALDEAGGHRYETPDEWDEAAHLLAGWLGDPVEVLLGHDQGEIDEVFVASRDRVVASLGQVTTETRPAILVGPGPVVVQAVCDASETPPWLYLRAVRTNDLSQWEEIDQER